MNDEDNLDDLPIHEITVENELINEYEDSLKIYCTAFPHLFPYGIPDEYKKKMNERKLIKHLMLFYDQRFALDRNFKCYVFNKRLRHDCANNVLGK